MSRRVDRGRGERQTTVAIALVDRAPLPTGIRVSLRVAREALALRQTLERAGGRWDAAAGGGPWPPSKNGDAQAARSGKPMTNEYTACMQGIS